MYNELSKRITELRKTRYKSAQKFADDLCVHLKTVQGWEHKTDPKPPTIDNLLAICNLFDCDADYLLGRMEEPTHEIKYIHEKTGLSVEAVQVLQMCRKCGADDLLNMISTAIVSDITPVKMKEGRITGEGIKPGEPATIKGDGSGVQGSGLIAALNRNMKSSIVYEEEINRLKELSKESTTPEELKRWFEQKRKVSDAQIKLDNSGYKMMLVCTTATAEGQEYHEILKEEYKKGGQDNG